MPNPLDFNDLRYYAAIVDAGSLTAASRKLGVTKSLLSQRLKQLEETLGVRLILRTTRRMKVTPLGQAFHRRCIDILGEIQDARRLIEEARSDPGGHLRISCPVAFAQTLLMPLVNAFLRENPDVNLTLDADYQEVDLLGGDHDLALKIQREMPDSRLVIRRFPLDQQWLVAAPSLLAGKPMPQTPDDLDGVDSVFLRHQGENPMIKAWLLQDERKRSHTIRLRPRLTSSDPLVLKQATIQGVGIALLPSSMCQQELADGRLVRLLPNHHGGVMHLYAAYPSRRALSRAARSFLDHLGDQLPLQLQQLLGPLR